MPLTGIELKAADLVSLLTHIGRWIGNLRRASKERKAESRQALRSVILAIRETEVYIRHTKDGGRKSIKKERDLALRWTELSFELQDIGLAKLSNRCRVTGKFFADPSKFDKRFLQDLADKLTQLEKLCVIADQENGPKGRTRKRAVKKN